MSAHISWSQLRSWWTWSTWQSGELRSKWRFSMGSAESVTPASIETGWVRLRGWCMVGLSMLVLFDLTSSPHRFGQSRSQFTKAPAWIWLIALSAVNQTGCPFSLSSVFIWQRVTLSDSRVSPPQPSMNVPVQSTSVTAWESCSVLSDTHCACRCQDAHLCWRVRHRSPPLCLCFSSLLFLLLLPPSLSFHLSPLTSPSLLFFTPLHWHVSQIRLLCASLAMHCSLYLA